MKPDGIPDKVNKAGVSGWYSSLDERKMIAIRRYIEGIDDSSEFSFFITLMDLAQKDDNFKFASFIADTASPSDMTDMQRFLLNEERISSYISAERYDETKTLCEENLSLYPGISEELKKKNNGIPDKLNCRNRLIDVMVGVESDYDGAFKMLDRFFAMGLLSEEDLALRKNSLKIHRMQRAFDGVYTYRPKE